MSNQTTSSTGSKTGTKTSQKGRTDLSRFENSWFEPGGSYLKRACWFLVNAIIVRNPANPFIGLKVQLLRWFGARIGERVIIKPGVNIKYPWNLKIGDYSWIGENAWLDNLVDIEIGSNVCISQGAYLLTGNHNYKKPTFDLMVDPIRIEDGVWIGANSTVTPGVTVHSHAILAAGGVATKDLDPYQIYQGNPAEAVRERVIENTSTTDTH